MNKLKMKTEDLTSENIEKLKELFPSVVSDGKIDFDKLKQELSADIVKSADSYDFTWVGKHDAVRKANEPVNAVLRPCPEESKNWEKTKNVYIEGDNLDVLKILYKSYAGKIKMIYIDPPYNTGNDFIYDDNFAQSLTEYRDNSHLSDEQGRQLKKLTNANGKYHSDWCSMMYPRLKLARKLLSDDGVIFISIDDHEVANLKKICDEVFGESNCLGLISVINNLKGRSDSEFFATCNEFVLVYSKNRIFAHTNGFELDVEEIDDDYKFEDEISKYKLIGFRKTGNGWKREDRPYMYYPVLEKDGCFSTVERDECIKIYNLERKCFNDEYVDELRVKYEQGGYKFILPKDEKGAYGRWRWGLETFFKEKDVNLAFNSVGTLCTKMRATIEDGSIRVKTAKTLWYKPEYDTGTSEKILKLLFAKNIFNNPKSQIYISDILKVGSNVDSIILDFFSGSATTAHAVMQLNAEDGGNRKFIMVQLPEVCDEKSEAYKAGYKNICEIGKERIRRAGEKIISETGKTDLDVGFRVFQLDSSNMKNVYFTPAELIQKEGADIEDLADNVKPDRNAADLLFGVMQYWNMTECLSAPHKTKEIDGFTIHIVQDGQYPELIACFDADVPETVITEMAKLNPLRAVFRERCFKTTQDRLNAERLLKNADIRLI